MDRQRVCDRATALLTTAESGGNPLRDQVWIRHRREIREPRAIRVAAIGVGRYLQRETSLPDSTGAAERNEARFMKRTLDIRDLPATSDKTRQLLRESAREASSRSGRGLRTGYRNPRARSAADWNRCSGAFSRHLVITRSSAIGMDGFSADMTAGA